MSQAFPLSPPPRLVSLQRLAAGGRWRVEAMRALSEPCLLWFTKGQGRITLQGQTRGYTAHNAIFIPPGVMHGYEVAPNVLGTALFFSRDHDLSLPKEVLHLRLREASSQQEIAALLEAVQREITSDQVGAERAWRHHIGLLSVWLERQALRQSLQLAQNEKKQEAHLRLARRFSEILEAEYRSGANVGELAARLGVSATHLSRCCRAACGRPASALLADRKLFEARKLLTETDLPIQRIASDLGFTSAAYFTRAFQNLIGKSPSAFRRLN